jgi:hypothetical protein
MRKMSCLSLVGVPGVFAASAVPHRLNVEFNCSIPFSCHSGTLYHQARIRPEKGEKS